MRKKFNKKPVILAAAALALTVSLSVGSALAYFTAYSTAKGTVPLNIGFTETVPEETVDENGKHVVINNIGDYDCFVRVKVFSDIEVTYNPKNTDDWTDGGDGYWYYNPVLPAGEKTSELVVSFEYPTGEDKTEEFNIIVIQECTPVVYNADGSAAADWTTVIPSEGTE